MAARPSFRLDPASATAVARIAARLDGLPLAIELTAVRVRLLSPDAILGRLERQFELDASGARDVPERQRTLRGAISWSYDLLDEPEPTSARAAGRLRRRLRPRDGGTGLRSVLGTGSGCLRRDLGAGRPEPYPPLRDRWRGPVHHARDDPGVRSRTTRGPRRGRRHPSSARPGVRRDDPGCRDRSCAAATSASGSSDSNASTTTSGRRSPGRSMSPTRPRGRTRLRVVAVLAEARPLRRGTAAARRSRPPTVGSGRSDGLCPAARGARRDRLLAGRFRAEPSQPTRSAWPSGASGRPVRDGQRPVQPGLHLQHRSNSEAVAPTFDMRLGRPLLEESLAIYRELGDQHGIGNVLWALGSADMFASRAATARCPSS